MSILCEFSSVGYVRQWVCSALCAYLGEHSQITSRSKGGEGVRSIVTKCDVREGGG